MRLIDGKWEGKQDDLYSCLCQNFMVDKMTGKEYEVDCRQLDSWDEGKYTTREYLVTIDGVNYLTEINFYGDYYSGYDVFDYESACLDEAEQREITELKWVVKKK